ncbi:MAG: alpha/beta hydrolase [Candidatus Zixiibacteriota bacterium]
MSKKTKETVQTTVVLVLIVLFIAFYIIYPLITVRKMTSRPESGRFRDPEFTLENNPAAFIEKGLPADTFAVSTDDNIRLAAVYFRPDSTLFSTPLATVILIHDIGQDRTSMIPYIRPFLDSGLAVVVYDQRACGLSGGRFHTPGRYEAEDLNQLIIKLKFDGKISRPLIAVGFGSGADAAMLASEEEMRLNRIIAIDPNLTPNRWLTNLKNRRGTLYIPLYRMVYYWWYKKLSGFPYDRFGSGGIQPLTVQTELIMSDKDLAIDEVSRLKEISGDLLITAPKPDNDQDLMKIVMDGVYTATRTIDQSET